MKPLNPVQFIEALKGLLDGKVDIPETQVDNQLLKVLLTRRSVRSFQKKDIPNDVVRVILEAGRLAPSTVNLQSWAFDQAEAGLHKLILYKKSTEAGTCPGKS
jgi:Nitroreductase family